MSRVIIGFVGGIVVAGMAGVITAIWKLSDLWTTP